MPKHPKRPRDPNQLGKLIVDLATGAIEEDRPGSRRLWAKIPPLCHSADVAD